MKTTKNIALFKADRHMDRDGVPVQSHLGHKTR